MMSSLYKKLSNEDLKINSDNPALIPPAVNHEDSSVGLKVMAVGAFLISLFSLIGAGILYQQVNAERRERQALEASQAQLQEKAKTFEEAAQKSHAEIERLQGEVNTLTESRKELKVQFETNRREFAVLQKKMQEIEERSKAIEDQAKLAESEDAGFDVPAASAIIPAGTAAAGVKSAAVKPGVAQPAPVVKKEQILTVNRKFNFAVINIGIKDKVKMGDKIIVDRQGKQAGALQVEKLYDNFSAATITEENKSAPIKEGDLIRKA